MNTSYIKDSNKCDHHNAVVTTITVEESGWGKEQSRKVKKGAMGGRIMYKRTDILTICQVTIIQETTSKRSQMFLYPLQSTDCKDLNIDILLSANSLQLVTGTKPEIIAMTVNCIDKSYSGLSSLKMRQRIKKANSATHLKCQPNYGHSYLKLMIYSIYNEWEYILQKSITQFDNRDRLGAGDRHYCVKRTRGFDVLREPQPLLLPEPFHMNHINLSLENNGATKNTRMIPHSLPLSTKMALFTAGNFIKF
uniref:Uncharacterized protein n=1 Tax=Glossina austeni TaxID=7395 RepID=A0A1A9V5K2_GLOAU